MAQQFTSVNYNRLLTAVNKYDDVADPTVPATFIAKLRDCLYRQIKISDADLLILANVVLHAYQDIDIEVGKELMQITIHAMVYGDLA